MTLFTELMTTRKSLQPVHGHILAFSQPKKHFRFLAGCQGFACNASSRCAGIAGLRVQATVDRVRSRAPPGVSAPPRAAVEPIVPVLFLAHM